MPLTRAHIEQIAEKLKRMPPAPAAAVNATKQEAVKLLANEIAGLQRRGYALEQIAESLRSEGLDLSTATLKSYLSRVKSLKRRRDTQPRLLPVPREQVPTVAGAETTPLKKEDTPVRSGKDAFLVKDKDSY